jgi:hypothetical protein
MSVRSVLEQSGRAALCGPRLMVVTAAVGARRRSTEHEGGRSTMLEHVGDQHPYNNSTTRRSQGDRQGGASRRRRSGG